MRYDPRGIGEMGIFERRRQRMRRVIQWTVIIAIAAAGGVGILCTMFM